MSKNMINITNRLFTSLMLLIAIISSQNITQENPNRRLIIKIEEQENRVINIHSDSHTGEVQESYALGKKEPVTD